MIALERITLLTNLRRFSAKSLSLRSCLSTQPEGCPGTPDEAEDSPITSQEDSESPYSNTVYEDGPTVERPIPGRSTKGSRFILVSRSTGVHPLAVALTHELKRHGSCEAVAAGARAITQFVWGAAIARDIIIGRKEGDLCFQGHHRFWMDRNSTNQLLFTLNQTDQKLDVNPFMSNLRVRQDTDIRGLSMSLQVELGQRGRVAVYAIGVLATARMIVASVWIRRLCLSHKIDVDCYPSLSPSDIPALPHGFHQVGLTLVERSREREVLDREQLLAVWPVVFSNPADSLPTPESAFSESVDVELPIVKIASQTPPDKAAGTLMSFLCSTGGVQVFTTGSMANNQALKAITVCRSYVRESIGYDVGFQCIHAPRDNRNGECQLVTWLRLMQDTSDQLSALDNDKIQFRIGDSNDAKMVGKSMASQIERSGRLDCMAVGVGAAGRSMVAISHARIHLAQKQLDLVVLPNFDSFSSFWELRQQKLLPLKFDILSIKKSI